MQSGNGDALDVINTAVAFIVIAYFIFLLITNQRLVVLTSNSVQISPQQNITEHSVHMGTAFIAAMVLIPRVGMMCGQMCSPAPQARVRA